MPSPIEKLQAVNSFIRTMLTLVLAGGVGTAGWFGYQTYTGQERTLENVQKQLTAKDKQIANGLRQLEQGEQQIRQQQERLVEKDVQIADKQATIVEQKGEIVDLNKDIEEKKVVIDRLETSLLLHKMQRRLARVTVLDVDKDPDTGKQYSQIEFVELNELGDPVGESQEFRLEGDVVYVDYWVVKFDDKYIEQADLERGTSICLFHRIFGEFQKPKDGFSLDKPGTRPGAYTRGGVISDFEKKIWEDFWKIANNTDMAAEMGIRALHGDAVSIKVVKDKTYRITVRASGGPEIELDENGVAPGTSAIYSRSA